MKKLDVFLILFFFLIGILSRLPLVEKYQSHWDGPQYSIGIVRYNLSEETPSTPGYPLYIAMGRIFYEFTNNPHYSILLVSVLFSGLGGLLMYIAGKTIFNRVIGIIASLLYLSGPTFYYFGLTAYPYGLIPVCSTALALCVYFSVVKKRKLGIILGALLAIAIGIRPQESPMFIPLFLLGFYYFPKKQRILSLLTFVITTIIWFIPFMYLVGGINEYLAIFTHFLKQGAIDSISIHNSLIYASRMGKDLFLTFTVALFFFGYYLVKHFFLPKKKEFRQLLLNKNVQLFSIWIIPSFLVNLFIRSDHAGYQMTYLSAFIFLIAYAIYALFRKNKLTLIVVIVFCISFNMFWFFRNRDSQFKGPYIPTSFHYSEIRKNDIKLGSKISYIEKNFNPQNTLIITTPDPWRPLMYHLKPYEIYSIDALYIKDENYINLIRISKNWNRVQKEVKTRSFKVPDQITNIVFSDDQASSWVKNKNKKIVDLPGMSKLTILKVSSHQTVTYNFHYVDVQ